jgi:hypothetical protein
VRVRRGRYDHLTIFLLLECQVRHRHLNNCAGGENLGGTQKHDTYADLAHNTCRAQTRHPTEEGFANRGVHATTQCSHAIAYRPAVRSVSRALGHV